jgi:phage terminase large subunit GpA-like protein
LIDQYKVPPPQAFIDIGYEQDRILDLCVKHGWTGIKGDGNHRFFTHPTAQGKPVEKLFSKIRRARSKSGGIAKFMFVASNPVKDVLSRMVTSGESIELPADLSKAFENHMKCERRTVERHPKTGEEKSVWLRPGSKPNHLWDCMVYQVGAALAFRVFDDNGE